MTAAALARLNDLAATVEGLKQQLARPDLPGLMVAEATVAINEAAAVLDRHAARLARAGGKGDR